MLMLKMSLASALRRRIPAALALGALAFVASACSDPPEVAKQKALARGERYFAAGSLNEAVIELQNALRIDHDLLPAVHLLGRAYARKAWQFDAIRELSRARRLAPDSLPIVVDLARALAEIGAWREVAQAAAEIEARDPRSADAAYLRVVTLLGQGKPQQALDLADRTGIAFPEQASVRAEALLSLGQTEQAEQAFRAALAENPADARSLAGLGAVSIQRRNFEEAARYYVEAKKVRPEAPRIRLWLAASRAWLGKVDEAIRELEEVELQARTPDISMALGIYYVRAGQPAEAIARLAPLVRLLPRLAPARLLLASAYLASNDGERARTELLELETQLPGDAVVQFRLALAEIHLGHGQEALARLDRVAKPFQRSAEYHFERGRALLLLGRAGEALKAGSAAQQLAPQAPQPYLLMGQIRAQQGDARAARELYARAAAVDTGYAPAHVALGEMDLAHGQADAALQAFDAALRADPRSMLAIRTKAMALLRHRGIKEAIAFLEGVVKEHPRMAAPHTMLGALYVRDRRPDRARAAFDRTLEIDSRSVDARIGLARLALDARKEDDAASHLVAALRQQPDHPIAVLLVASIHANQGRADLSVPILEAAVKARPRDATFELVLGDLYLKTARHDLAVALMDGLLKRSPGSVSARLVKGQALLARGQGEAGLREIREAARLNPKSAQSQYVLAHALVGLGHLPEAQAAYRETLRLDPSFEIARIEMAALGAPGTGFVSQDAALARLEAAVKADPKNVRLREALARALFLRGRLTDAYSELTRILELAPLHLGANQMAAQILLGQGKGEEAARYLEAVLRNNPSHAESSVLLARHLAGRGRVPEAIDHLEAALRVNPTMVEARLQLGQLYVRIGRLDDALAAARELEQSAPRSAAPHLLKGAVLIEQKNHQAALASYEAALKVRPDLAEAHRGAGQAWEGLGQPERAVEAYQRALAANARDVVALNNLAWLLMESRRSPEQALPLATQAAQLAPQSAEVMDTLGWIHYQRGHYVEAEKALARAVERAPGNAMIHYHLGMAYYRQGKKTDALYSLRRAVQIEPRLREREGVASLLLELGG